MKDVVKYLGIMTDSELSWKHHVTLSVTKLIDRLKQLLNWGITFHGIFFWFISCTYSSLFMVSVHGATFHGPTSVTYLFCRNVHCIWFIFRDREAMQSLFFIESNCLPLPSLFFQQSSYLMHEVHAKTAPKKVFSISLRKSIQNIIIIRDYLQKNSNSLQLKKWKTF